MTRFKPIKVSRQTELWYSRQLLAEVKALCSQVERALQQPQSPFLLDSENAMTAFNTERFLAIIKKFAETDRTPFAENLAHQFVIRGNQQNAREVSENLKRQTGVDLQGLLNNSPKVAEKMHAMTQANVQLIQSIHSQYLDKVQTAVTQAVISGQLNATLAKQIKEIGGVTENRARFIARDQAAKLNGVLTQARHEELGIKKYRWSTSGDERVRDSHAENDGKIFRYDQPPETGHPGQGFNCRCVQIPVIDDEPTDKEKKNLLPPQEYAKEIISHKPWSNEFKEKAEKTHNNFAVLGIIVDVHGLARYLQRFNEIDVSQMAEIIKQTEPNFYDEETEHLIRFLPKKKLAIIQSKKDKQIISFVKRSRESKKWKKIK